MSGEAPDSCGSSGLVRHAGAQGSDEEAHGPPEESRWIAAHGTPLTKLFSGKTSMLNKYFAPWCMKKCFHLSVE